MFSFVEYVVVDNRVVDYPKACSYFDMRATGAIGRAGKSYVSIFAGQLRGKIDTYALIGLPIAPVVKHEQTLKTVS